MMEKKNKGKTVLIVFLILIILGLGGYIVYDKVLKEEPKEKTKEEVQTSKEESLDVTSKEVTTLFNNINKLSSSWTSDVYYGWLFKQDSLKVEDMSDELKVAVALYKEYIECISNDYGCVKGASDTSVGNTVISSEKVQDNIIELFGNIKYNNTNTNAFDCGENFTFDSNQNVYTATAPACGYAGNSFNTYDYRITKAMKNDNSLDIYVKVAFEYFDFQYESDEHGNMTKDNMRTIYTDFNKKNEINKVGDTEYNFNEILENYGDKLPVYKLHFEKEDGEYHFKSIEKQ